MIDLKKEPIDNFVDLLKSKNPKIPDITSDDIAIRRLNLFTYDRWPKAVVCANLNPMPSHGAKIVAPTSSWAVAQGKFILRKKVTFPGGEVTIQTIADNGATYYIDGVAVLTPVTDWDQLATDKITVAAGEHDLVVVCGNGTGPGRIGFAISNVQGKIEASDATWPCWDITGDTVEHWINPNGESAVEVDLLVEPSEAIGDYAKFNYERITMPVLFGGIDVDAGMAGVQIPYHIDDIDMLLGSVDNFKSIFNTWYRFSHNGSYTYPANASELNGWRYIEEYDCIESTINSGTYVGFISDDLVGDYEFNTVITSNNGDDDAISIVLAGFKQGDIDDHEHTLELVFTRGGLNGSFVRINSNYSHVGNKIVRILDPNTTKPNSGNPWTPWYGHAIAKRIGDKLYVWCKQERLPALESGQTRDQMISGLVSDLARWDEDDWTTNGYLTTVIDLSVEETKFNRTVRYGYGQQSQAASRFWNIRRPGDNPNVTPKMKGYLIDRYGVNVGSDGVSVANMGANIFKLSLDNILYYGDLELSPTNRRYMLGAAKLLADGKRFSHNTSDTYPAVPAEMANWTLDGDEVKFGAGTSFTGVVTPYKSTEYEFHTDVRSEGGQNYPVGIVVAFVEHEGRELTLTVLADVPEWDGGGEWSMYYNTLQSDVAMVANNGGSPEIYRWEDITTRNIYVKRVGDIIEVTGNNKANEPGRDWTFTLDLSSDPKYAPFRKECHFGYGCYTQQPSWFRDKIV